MALSELLDPAALPSWLALDTAGVRLRLHVQPGARRSAVVGVHGDRLKIALQAPPVEGKANAALMKLLAQWLHVPQRDVVLISGHGSREKVVAIVCSAQRALTLTRSDLP